MLDTDGMYKEYILDLYKNPINKKALADYDIEHREHNPSCGDDITIQIKFDEQEDVAEIGYQGHGCAISEAATSLLIQESMGKPRNVLLALTEKDIYALLGFEVVYTRRNCALLGLQAIQNAMSSKYI